VNAAIRPGRAQVGISLVEIALAVVLLAGVLAVVAAAYNHVLTQARVGETQVLLTSLSRATVALDEHAALRVLQDDDEQGVLAAICADPAASAAMHDVSPYLWRCSSGVIRCVDAWRTPIRVVTRSTTDAALGQRLQLAGGGALYESAGPDRDFGTDNTARRMDNLRSDDPDIALEP